MATEPGDAFIPAGVDATSWLAFEARVQQRRFAALLMRIDALVADGDLGSARLALAEAVALRPEAPELAALDARLALRGGPPFQSGAGTQRRVLSGACLLLVGMSLLLLVDSAQRPGALPTAAPARGPASASSPSRAAARSAALPSPSPARDDANHVGTNAAPLSPVAPSSATAQAAANPVASTYGWQPPVEVHPAVVPPYSSQPLTFLGLPHVPSTLPTSRLELMNEAAAATELADAAPPIPTATEVEAQVVAVLGRYADAYGQLDARAAREVWPTVDERALERAFAGLTSQALVFDRCAIDVQGATANASCSGTARYVTKIGSAAPRNASQTWEFRLQQDGDAWTIARAEAYQP